MNIDLKDIPVQLAKLGRWLKKYIVFIAILTALGIYLFVVWQIRSLANSEPTTDQVNNKVNELKTPRLDQDAVNRILQLEDQNVQIETLFNEARQNPFQE